jgi:hypothetical protein
MWRANCVRALLIAGLAVGLAVGLLGLPSRTAEARSTWERDGNVITITVNVAVIGADAANKAAFIKQAFELHYPAAGFQVSCFKVVFKLDIRASNGPVSGRHSVFVVPMNPGDPWIPEAQVLSRPSETSGRAYVSEWDNGSTLVHEITHLMGLPDEYSYNGTRDYRTLTYPDPTKAPEYVWNDSAPANGTIEPHEVSLRPGQTGSLMADGFGRILNRHAAELLRKTVPADELRCEWVGEGSISETPLKDDHRELTRAADFEFTFDIDPEGNVVGEIRLSYEAKLTVEDLPSASVGIATFDPEVGGEITDPNPTRTFPLTGSLRDDFLTLEIATPVESRPTIEFTILADPGVSAGLSGVPVTAPGGVQIIKIEMVPFSPFGAPGEVEVGPQGPRSASASEVGDNYRLEWEARLVGD